MERDIYDNWCNVELFNGNKHSHLRVGGHVSVNDLLIVTEGATKPNILFATNVPFCFKISPERWEQSYYDIIKRKPLTYTFRKARWRISSIHKKGFVIR